MRFYSRLLLLPCLAALLLILGLAASTASAYPGAYRVLMVHATCDPPTELRDDIAAFQDVSAVDLFEACKATPTAAQLMSYDLVVSMSNDFYLDQSAYGDALTAFVDSGGVVVQYAYDNWEGEDSLGTNGPAGRFLSGGYEPFIAGDNKNEPVTLGEFDASSPLMQGVTSLASSDNTAPALAPGAVLVAKWSDGRNLIAYKGRVVSVSAYTGDDTTWSGDFGRLTMNAVRWLGGQTLTVIHPTPGGGAVTSGAGGLSCETFVCTAQFIRGSAVTLTGAPRKGFAFAGFSGDCKGPSCALTMDSPKTVTASFIRFAVLVHSKLKRNRKKGTATLTFRVGGPGKLVLAGKTVKRQAKVAAAASNVKIPVIAKGKAAKRLDQIGSAKVGIKVTFTPSEGTPASLSRPVRLIQAPVHP